jgi:hypothetical protein
MTSAAALAEWLVLITQSVPLISAARRRRQNCAQSGIRRFNVAQDLVKDEIAGVGYVLQHSTRYNYSSEALII